MWQNADIGSYTQTCPMSIEGLIKPQTQANNLPFHQISLSAKIHWSRCHRSVFFQHQTQMQNNQSNRAAVFHSVVADFLSLRFAHFKNVRVVATDSIPVLAHCSHTFEASTAVCCKSSSGDFFWSASLWLPQMAFLLPKTLARLSQTTPNVDCNWQPSATVARNYTTDGPREQKSMLLLRYYHENVRNT